MHLSNKKINPNDLSILIHGDGFSFCTHDQHHLFTVDDDFPSQETLKSWMDYHQLNPTNIKLVYAQEAAVTIPNTLFDQEHPELYLKSATGSQEQTSTVFTLLEENEQVVVFGVPIKTHNLFKSLFSEVTVCHYVAELLPALSSFSFGKGKKNLFVHLRKDAFDLFLFQGGQLLIQNSFPQKNADDFLYYLFYVTEQFYLKPDQFDLYFLGKYLAYDAYYAGTKEFHHSIEYLDPHYPLIDSHHPIPFFQTFTGK